MAEKKGRPIRIEIPSELRLTRDQITSLDNVFENQLNLIEGPGPIDPAPFPGINTTKFAVEIDVIRPRRKPAKKKSKQPAAKKKKTTAPKKKK